MTSKRKWHRIKYNVFMCTGMKFSSHEKDRMLFWLVLSSRARKKALSLKATSGGKKYFPAIWQNDKKLFSNV
jgi:hypothetical protein